MGISNFLYGSYCKLLVKVNFLDCLFLNLVYLLPLLAWSTESSVGIFYLWFNLMIIKVNPQAQIFLSREVTPFVKFFCILYNFHSPF